MRTKFVSIRFPIWNNKQPEIGIAEWILNGTDFIEIEIEYRRKDGTKSFPGRYRKSVQEIQKGRQDIQRGTKLRVTKLQDWEQKEE